PLTDDSAVERDRDPTLSRPREILFRWHRGLGRCAGSCRLSLLVKERKARWSHANDATSIHQNCFHQSTPGRVLPDWKPRTRGALLVSDPFQQIENQILNGVRHAFTPPLTFFISFAVVAVWRRWT